MDLPCSLWQDYVGKKWTGLDSEIKEHFKSLRQIGDVFKSALSLTTQDDVDVMRCICAGDPAQKDSEQAAECRERGNSSFRTRDYTAAALHYTQGLCLAPQMSEQLSLSYANRSAALFHLQYYQECLNDIDKALQNGYPAHLLHKLEDRRTKCLNLLGGGQKAKRPISVDELTFGISPQASVEFSPEEGRHLVAVERISAGQVILEERAYSCVLIPSMKRGEPGAETGPFGTEHRRCHRCLTETLCAVPCEGCSYSRYCSAGCKNDAWEEHHRWECPLHADLTGMGVMAQLALRVALKAGLENVRVAQETVRDHNTKSERRFSIRESERCQTPHPAGLISSDSYLNVFHLLHHLDCQSPGVRFLCAVTIAALYRKLCSTGPPPASWDFRAPAGATGRLPGGADVEDRTTEWSSELWLLGSTALRHMLQLRCNAQAILALQDTGLSDSPVLSSQEIRIATAIFPTLSLLNHSCCPNTSLVFSTGTSSGQSGSNRSSDISEATSGTTHGVTATVRAAKAIAPGEEVLHCYGPHSSRMATVDRTRLLQEQYYFLCRCEACSQQGGGSRQARQQQSHVEGSQPKSGLLCSRCRGPLRKSSKDKGTELTCLQPSCGYRMTLSEVSHRLQQVRIDLEKAVDLMEREQPGEALRLLQRRQSQCDPILAPTHPLQGELADAMARAYATMGDWNNAALHLDRSLPVTGAQYGDDSMEMARQLFKLAQLHFNGGARAQALSVIPKVRRLLCLHCGRHCPEMQELQAMEDCLHG